MDHFVFPDSKTAQTYFWLLRSHPEVIQEARHSATAAGKLPRKVPAEDPHSLEEFGPPPGSDEFIAGKIAGKIYAFLEELNPLPLDLGLDDDDAESEEWKSKQDDGEEVGGESGDGDNEPNELSDDDYTFFADILSHELMNEINYDVIAEAIMLGVGVPA